MATPVRVPPEERDDSIGSDMTNLLARHLESDSLAQGVLTKNQFDSHCSPRMALARSLGWFGTGPVGGRRAVGGGPL